MNESAVLTGLSSEGPVYRSGAGQRKLSEDIFPSAEEAVLAEQVHGTGGFSSDAQVTRPPAVRAGDKRAPLMGSLRTQVAEYPCRSALMAAAAGALAMIMLRSQLRRRAGSHLPRWIR